jgi:hypothetical protein
MLSFARPVPGRDRWARQIGRHELARCSVHFARAYTPYGPLASAAGHDLTLLILRAHADAGEPHLLPAKRAVLEQARANGHKSWQIVRNIAFPPSQPETDAALQAVSEIEDENGLGAYTLTLKAHREIRLPDAGVSDGRYVLIVSGSALHAGIDQQCLSLMFVKPEEGALQITAGKQGLQALVLNFPRLQIPSRDWLCVPCGFVYNEAARTYRRTGRARTAA